VVTARPRRPRKYYPPGVRDLQALSFEQVDRLADAIALARSGNRTAALDLLATANVSESLIGDIGTAP
jgi:hypothetical protein